MSAYRRTPKSNLALAARKFGLSAFVVFTFGAYAVHERMAAADASAGDLMTNIGLDPSPEILVGSQSGPALALLTDNSAKVANQPTRLPATAIPPTGTPAGMYVDGQYTGPVTDAYYGTVQVKAIVSSGALVDVQFLDYPHDRRTSQQINTIAMPWLTQEAVQVQNAHVNIISGATLTSEAFAESLQVALQSARSSL